MHEVLRIAGAPRRHGKHMHYNLAYVWRHVARHERVKHNLRESGAKRRRSACRHIKGAILPQEVVIHILAVAEIG